MDTVSFLLPVALAIVAGGLVKGTFGLGLPLVAMPLMTFFLSVANAISLLVVPMLATNLAQGFIGGWPAFVARLRRFAPTLIALMVCIAVSIKALVLIPEKILFALIGVAVIGIALLARFQPKVRIAPRQERWFGPLAGAVGGVLGGLTSFYGPPLMVFLAGLRLNKDEFVGAISLMYFMGAVGMAIGLAGFGIADSTVFLQSVLATLPAMLGIKLGQLIRVRLNEQRFAKWLFVMYLVIGLSFLAKAIP
ncbi:MAG TPA: sulfite exporter TauE/SafE family protein [Anaerolineales bacterium]|jgi:hypothetical protein